MTASTHATIARSDPIGLEVDTISEENLFWKSMPESAACLPASLATIVERLHRANPARMKYELLIRYAQKLPPFPASAKIPAHQVKGCTSQVWLVTHLDDQGRVQISGDADSQLVKGLLAILVLGLNGLTPTEILALPPDFIKLTGLDVSLTPSRNNGFVNMVNFLKKQVMAYLN
jgi:cysteine desulfuration protein SufE